MMKVLRLQGNKQHNYNPQLENLNNIWKKIDNKKDRYAQVLLWIKYKYLQQ